MTSKEIYTKIDRISASFMILALLWLTISTPFVFASQQEQIKQNKIIKSEIPAETNEEGTTNPFGNTTEEKAPTGTAFSEEFLHDHHSTDHFLFIISQYYKNENADTYIAFHGELLVPPPNAA